MSHVAKDKKKLVARTRRINGQVASLERALESDQDCHAILQQIAAVRGAVNGLMLEVLEGHLREHVAPTMGKRNRAELDPVVTLLKRYLK
jgi:DNA-binding FrmR family transcriptional regulator